MQLSKKERALLLNQYQILKRLDPDNAAHWDELIEVLQRGYTIFYSMIDERLDDDMPGEEGRFVLAVLDLYQMVEEYKADNPGDTEISSHPWGYFHGFDGATEGQYMALARFLVGTQGKYPEQAAYKDRTDNFDGHVPALDRYKAMVAKWRDMGRQSERSRDRILEILNA
jgi:uncharacterized protein YfbU (UPF0304 family)